MNAQHLARLKVKPRECKGIKCFSLNSNHEPASGLGILMDSDAQQNSDFF